MYCPACGTRFDQPVTFCKNCGANLKVQREGEKAGTSIDSLIWGIAVTTITLLGMGLGALVLIKDGKIDAGLGNIFVILSFVALLVVDGVLLGHLMSLKKTGKTHSLPHQKDPDTNRLESPPARALHEPAGSMPSVTERTTRTLEPLGREDESR
jgi:hypothetical protein